MEQDSASMSRSPSHRRRSISPPKAPADSDEATPRPPHDANGSLVNRLASHLIAAKRSLSSTALVQRADTLVSTARKNVEDIAALSARNSFLREYARRELRRLEQLRTKLDSVKERGSAEFQAILRQLDTSDERVKKTLHLLKTTPVEPSLQPLPKSTEATPTSTQVSPKGSFTEASSSHAPQNASPQARTDKCLYDFVSEQGVDDLTRVVWKCIDSTQSATAEFSGSLEDFDENLQTIENLLEPASRAQEDLPSAASDKLGGMHVTLGSATHISPLFRSLEAHATDIAGLLQSLVRHYDLCITALKYTEGGGEAVDKAQALEQDDVPAGLEDLASREAPTEVVSDEELAEMIEVLDKDALEVDDVVQDIRDHASVMEQELDTIMSHAQALKTDYSRLRKAIQHLQDIGGKLTGYISAGSTFLAQWAIQKAKIAEKMEEFENMRDFYEGFLGAYDGLILEIGRRKVVQAKMEKVLADAMAKVSKLYDEDLEERLNFQSDKGDFLPVDLWPGLVDPPAKFEMQRVDGVTKPLPEISREAMQRAMQRRGKGP